MLRTFSPGDLVTCSYFRCGTRGVVVGRMSGVSKHRSYLLAFPGEKPLGFTLHDRYCRVELYDEFVDSNIIKLDNMWYASPEEMTRVGKYIVYNDKDWV